MSPESIKNDIRIVFLTLISFNALVTGVFPLSLGTAAALSTMELTPAINGMVMALPLLGLASLGGFGAIRDNEKMLVIYSAINGVLSAAATAAVAAHVYTTSPKMNTSMFLQFAIFNICTSFAATALSVALAKRAAGPQSPGSPQTAPRSGLWRGLGVAVAIVVVGGLVIYFG